MSLPQKHGEGTPKAGKQDWPSRLRQISEQAKTKISDGALTPAYRGNREEILELLNRALAAEWTSFLQYQHHYVMASDIHSPEIRDMWKDHAEEEREHAQKINERIDQLGGVPANDPKQIAQLTPTPFEAGHALRDMMEIDLVGEREAIILYSEIVRACGFDDIETRVLFEELLVDENEHANELANILYQQDASNGQLIPNIHDQISGELAQRERGAR